MLPLFKQIEIFSGIPTVYFKCKHFPQYTRELLEGLLGISTSERNPCRGKKLTTYRTNTHRGLSSSFTVSWLKILVQFSYNFKRRSYENEHNLPNHEFIVLHLKADMSTLIRIRNIFCILRFWCLYVYKKSV